jgi:hypothetical protein
MSVANDKVPNKLKAIKELRMCFMVDPSWECVSCLYNGAGRHQDDTNWPTVTKRKDILGTDQNLDSI